MKQQYTAAEWAAEAASLQNVFKRVALVDAYNAAVLDPVTLEPAGKAEKLPLLDEAGRGYRFVYQDGEGMILLYQALTVAGRACLLELGSLMPQYAAANEREADSYIRTLNQYRDDLRHDYVTGVFNRRFLDEEYRSYAMRQAWAGQPVGVVLVRVNEYVRLQSEESQNAADACLVTAAGILQMAVGADREKGALIRLEDGVFLAVSVGVPAQTLANAVRDALAGARREFGITLARRGEFTASLAWADWGETGSWEMLLALAERRLQEALA